MNKEDVVKFHHNLEKHLRNDYNEEERKQIEEIKARSQANTNRIIANCGGTNPLLGN